MVLHLYDLTWLGWFYSEKKKNYDFAIIVFMTPWFMIIGVPIPFRIMILTTFSQRLKMQGYIHLFCQMWIWGSKDGESSYSVTYNVMVAFLHEIRSHEIFGNWVFLSNQMLILTPAKGAHKWTEERCGKIHGAVQLNFFDGYWTQCNIFRRSSIGKLNIALDSAQFTFSPRKKVPTGDKKTIKFTCSTIDLLQHISTPIKF